MLPHEYADRGSLVVELIQVYVLRRLSIGQGKSLLRVDLGEGGRSFATYRNVGIMRDRGNSLGTTLTFSKGGEIVEAL